MVRPDTPAYFASDAARAAGIDVLTLQNWLKREAFGFTTHDKVGQGAGSRHLFTLRSVLILAVMAEIVTNGVTPVHAYRIARKSIVRDDLNKDIQTYIIVLPGGAGVVEALGGDHFHVDHLFDEKHRSRSQPDVASVLVIDPLKIKKRVIQRLTKPEGASS